MARRWAHDTTRQHLRPVIQLASRYLFASRNCAVCSRAHDDIKTATLKVPSVSSGLKVHRESCKPVSRKKRTAKKAHSSPFWTRGIQFLCS
ncbi:hypothetical protein J6590_075606 [Homalodisca vitripennis]|nr:hypothetical protein J6590_075606 [Homalodisca vitripennis]